MAVDRRTFLKTSAGAAAAVTLSGNPTGMTAQAAGEAHSYAEYLTGLGYQGIAPADLITGHNFNGGLSYDESHDYHRKAPGGEPEKWFVLQNCARLDDIAKRNERGVLAYFHILGCVNNTPDHPGEVLQQVLAFLLGQAKLIPERLFVVATEHADPYLERVESAAVAKEQIVTRPFDEAHATGDGSGYFRPDGHPTGPELHSLSLHYVPPGIDIGTEHKYPLPDHLEIGEFLFRPKNKPGSAVEMFSLGVERLAMAQGTSAGDFETSRKRLLASLEKEAGRKNVALPKAYHDFSAL